MGLFLRKSVTREALDGCRSQPQSITRAASLLWMTQLRCRPFSLMASKTKSASGLAGAPPGCELIMDFSISNDRGAKPYGRARPVRVDELLEASEHEPGSTGLAALYCVKKNWLKSSARLRTLLERSGVSIGEKEPRAVIR